MTVRMSCVTLNSDRDPLMHTKMGSILLQLIMVPSGCCRKHLPLGLGCPSACCLFSLETCVTSLNSNIHSTTIVSWELKSVQPLLTSIDWVPFMVEGLEHLSVVVWQKR